MKLFKHINTNIERMAKRKRKREREIEGRNNYFHIIYYCSMFTFCSMEAC